MGEAAPEAVKLLFEYVEGLVERELAEIEEARCAYESTVQACTGRITSELVHLRGLMGLPPHESAKAKDVGVKNAPFPEGATSMDAVFKLVLQRERDIIKLISQREAEMVKLLSHQHALLGEVVKRAPSVHASASLPAAAPAALSPGRELQASESATAADTSSIPNGSLDGHADSPLADTADRDAVPVQKSTAEDKKRGNESEGTTGTINVKEMPSPPAQEIEEQCSSPPTPEQTKRDRRVKRKSVRKEKSKQSLPVAKDSTDGDKEKPEKGSKRKSSRPAVGFVDDVAKDADGKGGREASLRSKVTKGALSATPKVKGGDNWICCLQYDDKKIACGALNSRCISVYDFETGERIQTLEGHTGIVYCLQFVDDKLISGSGDGTYKVWNMSTGVCLSTVEAHSPSGVLCLQFDDTHVVTGCTMCSIKMWNINTGAQVSSFDGHEEAVWCLRFSPTTIVSGSEDRTIRVWDRFGGSCIRVIQGHTAPVRCIAFDDEYIVSGSEDCTVRVYDFKTGERLRNLQGHTRSVICVHLDKDLIISGSFDKTIRVWDRKNPATFTTLKGHTLGVYCLQADKTKIMSGSEDGTILLWT